MPKPDALPASARVASREEAERLVSGVLATMGELETVLEKETAHVRVGRVRDGLAQEARKTELASAYLQGLEAVKANAIALARFAPQALDRLKAAQGRFGQVIATNQAVLATARAISENLVKDIAQEMNRAARPQVYAPAGVQMGRPARSEPLVLSRSL
jgi:hypothetical protein